ncbi:hypothetical protein FAF44_32950 [Nonomuraea sp. MG754425]|nr:hypothetical protein [Nonomuraea sp. MG754425]
MVKTHPRQSAGGRSTDRANLPNQRAAYAMRDIDALVRAARRAGPNIGIYAERHFDDSLPKTWMRQVYRLLGLVRRYGAGPVEAACGKALERDVLSVSKISAMLAAGTEHVPIPPPRPAAAGAGRFTRDPAEFNPVHRARLTLLGSSDVPERSS